MRLLRAFLMLMLALGASLPACAMPQGCEPAVSTTASRHHHMSKPAKAPARESADRHAGACIGCVAELPQAIAIVLPAMTVASLPVARFHRSLSGISPGAAVPPPRAFA